MTYAAYGLFDQVSETATFSEELKQRIAMSIRQAVLFHTDSTDYATILNNNAVQSFTGRGILFRTNSPTYGNVGVDGTLDLRSATNTSPLSFPSREDNRSAIVLGITPSPFLDNSDNPANANWVFMGIPNQGYYWARQNAVDGANISQPIIYDDVPSISFEDVDPYREFDPKDDFNPPFLNTGR